MAKKQKRTLLIDGDIVAFKITAALEQPIEWGDDIWTLHCDLAQCRDAFDEEIDRYMEALEGDDIVIAFSPPLNFRYRILPTYKHHRKGKRKPVCYVPLKEWVGTKYNTFQRPDLEGDDVLGILATSPKIIKGEKVIVSIDKDMNTIPALVCDMREPLTITEITEEQADYMHMYQTLVGDTADGYAGCPGVGPVRAEKILRSVPPVYSQMWPVVVEAYEKAGLGEEVALVQAQVARICRRDDYNFIKKQVIPWRPPKI